MKWGDFDHQVLDYIILSPSFQLGTGDRSESYTEDWSITQQFHPYDAP